MISLSKVPKLGFEVPEEEMTCWEKADKDKRPENRNTKIDFFMVSNSWFTLLGQGLGQFHLVVLDVAFFKHLPDFFKAEFGIEWHGCQLGMQILDLACGFGCGLYI